MGKRVLILSAGVGSGHNVAASALEAALAGHPDVDALERIDILQHTHEPFREIYSDTYFDLVKAVPWLVGWGYDYLDRPYRSSKVLSLAEEIMMSKAVQLIRSFRADAVICTHFLPSRLLSLLIARERLRTTLSVVTTDYDFQAMWFSSPFNRFYVAREETKAHMVHLGLPPDRITVSGIPVRPAFLEPLDEGAVRAKYGLATGAPVLLISAGAAGGDYAIEIVAQTLTLGNVCQAVVICGRNEELRAKIEALAAPRRERYRVLGFTEDMAALMRTADLFVGKPGGMTSSECMAVGLPMVLVNPIPGQEVRNSDFLLEEGAAVRCNYRTTVGYKIDELLGDRARLQRMSANAARIGRPHAAAQIAEAALAEPSRHFWVSSDAQRALRKKVSKGVIVAENEEEGGRERSEPGQTVSLRDAETGATLGIVTAAEYASLRKRMGALLEGQTLVMNDAAVRELARRRVDGDLVGLFYQMIGDLGDVIVHLPTRLSL